MSTGIGDTLRAAREASGRTLEDVARSVRARAEQLRALEEERFDVFGGDVYAKGFLRSYALELELDPEPLLDAYRQHYTGMNDLSASSLVSGTIPQGPRRTTPPAWLTWVFIGVVVVAGLAFLGMITNGFAPEAADQEEPVGPPPTPAPTPEDDGETPDVEPPDPVEPAPEPIYDGVELLVTLEEPSWLRVTVDGAVVLEQTMPAGETLQYQADEAVQLRVGNAGGVRLEVNGENLGAPGGRGEVVDVSFTREEFATAS
ncbi:MAG: RodZ domain-containing protein [Nitriliruptoraceae bacterium]